jgi:membrane protein DedA with SNARE-associated domain
MESFITSAGYAALILFGFLEAACIPIPSEVTFGFAGVAAAGGVHAWHPSLILVIIIGSLAELVGSMVAYTVGRVGGRPLVHRFGRYVLVTERDVDRAERFLDGRGAWAIPVGRMVPFVRAFISIVAGLVRVPPVRFGVLSGIGTVAYATVISVIGYQIGGSWAKFNHDFSLATYVIVVLVVLVIAGAVLYRWREFRREAAGKSTGSSSGTGGTGGGKHSAGSRPPERSGNAEVR